MKISVVRMNFFSKMLGMQTNISICLSSPTFSEALPPLKNYYVPGMKYQVLYLLHGGGGDDSDYLHFSSIARHSDEKKVVVVMPNNYNASYTDRENGPLYCRYIVEELRQMVCAYYPVSLNREDTFVGGLSMGGDGAMKLAISYPEIFGACLYMSGASSDPDDIAERASRFVLPNDPDSAGHPKTEEIFGDLSAFKGGVHDMWHLAKKNKREGRPLPRFYFNVGDKDYPQNEFVKVAYDHLTGLGYDTEFDLVPGYFHEWDFWDLALRKAFRGWFRFRRAAEYPVE